MGIIRASVFIFILVNSISLASEKILKDLEKAWSFYEQGRYIKMKNLSKKILEASKKEKFKKGIIEGYYYLGIANFSLGNLPEALRYANKTIEFSSKYHNYRWKAYGHVLAGEILRNLRKYDKALYHFQKAYQLSVEHKNEKMIPPALMNIGNIYYSKGDFEKAIGFYRKALEKAKKTNLRKSYIAFIQYNLGITYYRKKEYKNAIIHLEKAKSLYKQIGNKSSYIETKFYLGKSYMKSGNKEKAKEIFTEIVKEADKSLFKRRSLRFLKRLNES